MKGEKVRIHDATGSESPVEDGFLWRECVGSLGYGGILFPLIKLDEALKAMRKGNLLLAGFALGELRQDLARAALRYRNEQASARAELTTEAK